MTLLWRGVLREHPKLVQLLLKLNHPVDLRYAGCKTAMHYAAAFLVEAYLTVEASNKDEEDDEAVLAVNSVNDSRLKAAIIFLIFVAGLDGKVSLHQESCSIVHGCLATSIAQVHWMVQLQQQLH